MAATMRPQFGSCPAMAVLTRGELAMAMATRCASCVDGSPGHAHLDEFGGTFAVADHLMRQVHHHPAQRRLEGLGNRALDLGRRRLGRWPPASSVSEVEVSLSTVIELKVSSTLRDSIFCRAGRAQSWRR